MSASFSGTFNDKREFRYRARHAEPDEFYTFFCRDFSPAEADKRAQVAYCNQDRANAEACRRIQEKIRDDYRVICLVNGDIFDPKFDENMWDRYDDRHAGVRVHLMPCFWERRREELHAYHLEYSEVIPPYNPIDAQDDESINQLVRAVMTHKSSAWSLEKEWRLLIDTEDTLTCSKSGVPRNYLSVEAGDISGIDFGIDFPRVQRRGYIKLLKSTYPELRFSQAKENENDHVLDYQSVS